MTPAITAADFAAHVARLASDAFEGRKPGTLGERMTVTYLIDQFQRMGLAPGNRGSYLQTVPAIETTPLDANAIRLDVATPARIESLAYRQDVIVRTLRALPEVSLTDSELVFAGYGVVAPEYHWNDYAGVDVKGKTVIVLINDPGFASDDPSRFPGRAMTYYGRWTYKYEEAARQGAAGCLIVHDSAGAGYAWQVVVNSASGPQFDLPPSEDPSPRLTLAGWITTEAARRVFAAAGSDFDSLRRSADRRGFHAARLAGRLSTHWRNTIGNVVSSNVLGLRPGTERRDELVIYSAHWDHFGRDPSRSGNVIYHGAVDNGTGLAALLEIADAFVHQQPPPKRSVLFLASTLEEAGLLGSRDYTLHPVVPLAKTVADINLDALIPYGRTRDMVIFGYGQSELDDYLHDALAAEGRVIVPDEAPENGLFYRSDQLSFARRGVPVLFARGGFDQLEGGEAAGRAAYDDFIRNRYHQPTDEYDPHWDLSGLIEDVRALYAVGKRLASEDRMPQWRRASEFRAAREASRAAAAEH